MYAATIAIQTVGVSTLRYQKPVRNFDILRFCATKFSLFLATLRKIQNRTTKKCVPLRDQGFFDNLVRQTL